MKNVYPEQSRRAQLVLSDGTVFEGKSFGSAKSTSGEVVFATGMVGYDLSLTDPSYSGQILCFTYPLIGNWGVPELIHLESSKIQVQGLIISNLCEKPGHFQMTKTIDAWLREENIPGIYDIDTRKLTKKLRTQGVMLGKIIIDNKNIDLFDPNRENLVAKVSPKKLQIHKPESKASSEIKVGLLNCGAKENIKRNLLKRGATVFELPWDFDPFEKKLPIDGLLISNGPGDPKMADKSVEIIKRSLRKKLPTFGVCLGNQLLALAAGGDTYKLKFGHRAQNQPTIQSGTKRCYITTQNHGYAVDEKKMPKGFKRWFYNANDNTNEGIIHENLPFFSVQFHPEAAPGPKDTEFLFDFFLERIKKQK